MGKCTALAKSVAPSTGAADGLAKGSRFYTDCFERALIELRGKFLLGLQSAAARRKVNSDRDSRMQSS